MGTANDTVIWKKWQSKECEMVLINYTSDGCMSNIQNI